MQCRGNWSSVGKMIITVSEELRGKCMEITVRVMILRKKKPFPELPLVYSDTC